MFEKNPDLRGANEKIAMTQDQINEYIYSDIDIQHLNSSSCGWFCIAWMKWMQEHKHKDKKICYESFLKLFHDDPKKNEVILNKLLNQVL